MKNYKIEILNDNSTLTFDNLDHEFIYNSGRIQTTNSTVEPDPIPGLINEFIDVSPNIIDYICDLFIYEHRKYVGIENDEYTIIFQRPDRNYHSNNPIVEALTKNGHQNLLVTIAKKVDYICPLLDSGCFLRKGMFLGTLTDNGKPVITRASSEYYNSNNRYKSMISPHDYLPYHGHLTFKRKTRKKNA